MAVLSSLCVYCGSSPGQDECFAQAAALLGQSCAERGVEVIYGGGRVGLMGILAEAALTAGGKVTGIIPRHLERAEVGHAGTTRYLVVGSMHERKARMAELSDAFCALPGGIGTLDEFFEIITWKQLNLHSKPVVLLNLNGFWQPLLDLLAHQIAQGYLKGPLDRYFSLATSVDALFTQLDAAPAPTLPLKDQLI